MRFWWFHNLCSLLLTGSSTGWQRAYRSWWVAEAKISLAANKKLMFATKSIPQGANSPTRRRAGAGRCFQGTDQVPWHTTLTSDRLFFNISSIYKYEAVSFKNLFHFNYLIHSAHGCVPRPSCASAAPQRAGHPLCTPHPASGGKDKEWAFGSTPVRVSTGCGPCVHILLWVLKPQLMLEKGEKYRQPVVKECLVFSVCTIT